MLQTGTSEILNELLKEKRKFNISRNEKKKDSKIAIL